MWLSILLISLISPCKNRIVLRFEFLVFTSMSTSYLRRYFLTFYRKFYIPLWRSWKRAVNVLKYYMKYEMKFIWNLLNFWIVYTSWNSNVNIFLFVEIISILTSQMRLGPFLDLIVFCGKCDLSNSPEYLQICHMLMYT